MEQSAYTAIIVDDKQDNIDLLTLLVNKYCPKVGIVGSALNVREGIQQYYQHKPDMMFLDIQLEGESSFAIIDSIPDLESEIIFVSSYDEYAIKAISYNTSGYVLKPIDFENLVKTVNKTIDVIEKKKYVQGLIDKNETNLGKASKIIAIPSMTKIELIKTDDIVYAQADGRYTVFHLINGESKVTTKNLGEYEKKLDNSQFVRVHHSYIVNLNMIRKIDVSGGYYCEMMNNISLPIAKRRRDHVQRLLKLK